MFRLLICFIVTSNLWASTDLYIKSLRGNSMNVFCGAVAIDNGAYATAAHCVNEFHKEAIKVGPEKKSIHSIIKHSFYKKGYNFDQLDFAIIKAKNSNNSLVFEEVTIGDIVTFKNNKFKVVKVFETEFKVEVLEKGACLNDSGNAAYKGDKVVGILSRGDIGCKKFAIFTKMRPIVEWYKQSSTINELAKKSKITNLKHYLKRIKGY